MAKTKGFRASDSFFFEILPLSTTWAVTYHLSNKEILSHLMIVSKNENTYLKCLAHNKCFTIAIIRNHVSCNFVAPTPALSFAKGKCAGQGNVKYIFPSPPIFLSTSLSLFFSSLQTWCLLPSPFPGSVKKIPTTGSTFWLITVTYLSQT